ncbi:MAG: right-handed parallel beta-helix repeat-containing protein [Gemmataceae bacterium]|nr:right-handed parallel beta-helix repeat-containing protein [Gemmataceae bacterium]
MFRRTSTSRRPANRLNSTRLFKTRLWLTPLEERAVPAVFTVTNTLDDANPGSLRYALTQSEASGTDDTINFNLPANSSITFGTEFARLATNKLTIDGAAVSGLTIKGNAVASGTSRFLNLNATGLDVTVQNLKLDSFKTTVAGGAFILGESTLTLNNSTISGGSATSGAVTYLSALTGTVNVSGSTVSGNTGGGGSAFRIQLNGSTANVNISNSLLTGNTATGPGGVVYTFWTGNVNISNSTATFNRTTSTAGAGVISVYTGSVTVTNSVFTDNSAAGPGGALNSISTGSSITAINSTFERNTGTNGGAISAGSTGASSISGCTFSDNTATLAGGGFSNTGAGAVTISNSTFYRNSAIGTATTGGGGAINITSGTVTVNNSTIYSNSATGAAGFGGGGVRITSGTAHNFSSTIIAGNFSANPAKSADVQANLALTFASPGSDYNFIGVNAPATSSVTFSGANNKGNLATVTNPVMSILVNTGGPTKTVQPVTGSPVIGFGIDNGYGVDQRGVVRPPTGGNIGAVEGVFTAPYATLTPIADITANGATPNTVTVTYASSPSLVDGSTIDISDITITGPGGPLTILSVAPVSPPNAASIVATYTFAVPGGAWSSTANGTYTITQAANQVSNTTPTGVYASTLGSFRVLAPTTYTVDTLGDAASGTGGVSTSLTSGDLRWVLNRANADAGQAIINFGAPFASAQTITLGAALPTVTEAANINGPANGVTISGNGLFQVLNINATGTGSTFNVSNLTLTGGSAATSAARALNIGDETVNLTNVTIKGNNAGLGGGVLISAGPANVTFTKSVIQDNIGSGTNGAGIRSTSASVTLTIVESTIANNTTTSGAGGIYFSGATSSLTINRSTVSGNRGTVAGGVRVVGTTTGVNTFINSTFNGNGASTTSTGGGAINISTATVTLNNNTIVGNSAALTGSNGGGVYLASGSISLTSNILSGNTGAQDIHSSITLTSGGVGANYVGNKNALLTVGGVGNLTGTAPNLAPLGNYGGPTNTMQPLPGSPVLNVGNSTLLSPNVDQRNVARTGTPNIGSVEGIFTAPTAVLTPVGAITVEGATPDTAVVTYTSSLFNIDYTTITTGNITITGPSGVVAVGSVALSPSGTNATPIVATYTFTPPVNAKAGWDASDNGTYTITLNGGANAVFDTNGGSTTGQVLGTFSVTIPATYTVIYNTDDASGTGGKGSGLQGDLRYVITKANSVATVDNIVFDPTVFPGAGSTTIALAATLPVLSDPVNITGPGKTALTVQGVGTRVFDIAVAVGTNNPFSISNMTITGGSNGVANADESVTLTNVNITGNIGATGGAGVRSGGGTIVVINSNISGNTVTGTVDGGGIYLSSATTVTVTNSTIADNSTAGDGGGISFFVGGALTVTGSSITGNAASGATLGAGGVYIWSGSASITNTTISGNSAVAGRAGGIGAFSSGTITIKNSTIANNQAAVSGGGISSTSGTWTVLNTIISDNTAPTGPDVNGSGTITYSLIMDPTGWTGTASATNVTGVTADLAPLALNGGATLNHLPNDNSPVRDVGFSDVTLTVDQRGQPRPQGAGYDIGSVESITAIPVAKMTPIAPITVSGSATPNTIVVTYSDDQGINASSFNVNNVEIYAPGSGTPIIPTSFSVDTPGNGTPRVVTYTFAVPGGTWDAPEIGTWTVKTANAPNQVSDIDGTTHYVAGGKTLGTFIVNLPATYTVTLATDNSPTLGGEGSGFSGDLRYVLGKANATAGALDTITFGSLFTAAQTITLTGDQEIRITDGVVVNGPGADKVTVAAGGANRVFNVDNIVPGVIPVTLTGMKIQGGSPTVGIGGNIYNADESLTLDGVWVDSGSASGGGGLGMNAAGSLTIRNSTFSNNSTTTGNGAAVYITGATTITVSNSTFSGNNATGLGGALYGTATTANVTLNNSTIVYNSAAGTNGGGIYISGGTISIESTIVSDNSNSATPDIFASKVNSKSSLIGTADVGITTLNNLGGTISGTQLVPVSAKLDPLAFNAGGKMQTHTPQAGSPVYNAGSNPNGLTTDQNGNTRVLQGAADIGSVESLATVPTAAMTPIGTVTVDGSTTPSSIVVTYSDDTAINASTFKNENIILTGPGGPIAITGFSVDLPGNGTPRVVTYTFAIPGGSWDGLENGVYTITTTSVSGDQVTDTDGVPNPVPASTIGTFTVAIPRIYTVDITTDDTPVTGKSTSATTGDLRWCIDQANTDGANSVINFKGSVFTAGTKINLLQGELPVIAGVTINGPGAGNVNVVASPGARVFNVADTVTVTPNVSTISGMTISGGSVTGAGGGVLVTGEDLTITNVTVTGNTAVGNGGGISIASATGGKVSVIASTVSGNRATGTGANGGGINLDGAQDLVVTNSTVSGNTSGEDGGGIYFFSGGTMVMTGSTVSGNVSNAESGIYGAGGGGMYFWNMTATIVNSTISGNSSNSKNGGGMVVLSSSNVTLKNSTLAFNDAGTASGGNINMSSGTVTLTSTLITGGIATTGPDVNGAVTSNNSLISNQSGTTVTGSALSGAAGLDATLKNNGGPTQTHALLAGSVAINAGSNPDSLAYDQRGVGFNRVTGSAADIGAYEVQATPSKVTSVVINAGTTNLVQRSRVTNLRVTFDNPVTIADVSKAFSLSKDGGGSVTLSTTLSGGNTVADIIFTGGAVDAPPGNQTVGNQSLVNGKYTFVISAAEFSNGFDGGAGVGTNYTLASTSYGGPGTPATGIFRVFGDATGNGKVESDDFLAFRLSFLGTNDWFDYNGNGSVDSSTDLLQFRLNFLQQV